MIDVIEKIHMVSLGTLVISFLSYLFILLYEMQSIYLRSWVLYEVPVISSYISIDG